MKSIKTFLYILFCLLFSIPPSQKAHAVFAVSTGIPFFIASAVVAGGVDGFVIRHAIQEKFDDGQVVAGMLVASFLFVTFLDQKNPASLAFDTLNEDALKKLKIKREAMDVFNSELEETRSIAQSLIKDMLVKYKQNKKIDLNLISNEATLRWKNICELGQLSQDTCLVINAIRNQQR